MNFPVLYGGGQDSEAMKRARLNGRKTTEGAAGVSGVSQLLAEMWDVLKRSQKYSKIKRNYLSAPGSVRFRGRILDNHTSEC